MTLRIRSWFESNPGSGVFIAAAGIAIGCALYLLAVGR